MIQALRLMDLECHCESRTLSVRERLAIGSSCCEWKQGVRADPTRGWPVQLTDLLDRWAATV